jgi:hypothetical protein
MKNPDPGRDRPDDREETNSWRRIREYLNRDPKIWPTSAKPPIPICPICYGELDVDGIVVSELSATLLQAFVLPCTHMFCGACLTEAINQQVARFATEPPKDARHRPANVWEDAHRKTFCPMCNTKLKYMNWYVAFSLSLPISNSQQLGTY